MKAYQVMNYGAPLVCNQIQIPTPSSHQVLAKILVTGLCHTDIHVINGDFSDNENILPITPGHEGVGHVVKLGENVKSLQIGDRIAIPWLGKSCLNCTICNAGKFNLCQNQLHTGHTTPGSFAEYTLADERFCVKIPPTMSDESVAPIICAGLTSYAALKAANISPGSRIVISGAAGGLGHLAIQYAKRLRLEVVALDVLTKERESVIHKCGADYIVDVKLLKEQSVTTQLQKITETKPIEAAIVLAPHLSAVTDAVDYVSPGGKIVCVGLPSGSFQIPCAKFILKGLHMMGSIVGTPQDLREAIQIASESNITPHSTIYGHTQIPKLVTKMQEGNIIGRALMRFSAT